MENELFQKIPSLQVIICRQCKHGVRPAEVERHLKRKHQFKHQSAHQLAQAVQQWEDIEQDSAAIQIPPVVDNPLPILPCEPSGLLCQRHDPLCHYVASNMGTMRNHWRQVHQWSQQTRRGRVGQRECTQGAAELRRSFTTVAWQQIFPSGPGSHYIHIRFPEGHPPPPPPPPPADQAQRAVDAIITAWDQARTAQEQQAVIQADWITDANPWLRRTGWARYLEGVHPQDLLRLVEAPPEEPPDPIEQAIQAIWNAMGQLAWRSQQTVQRCGTGICMEAARTEAGQTPYRPLQAYMDETSVQKHVQAWQQVLGFIARTQATQAGQGMQEWCGPLPVYGMTARQQRKWQILWQLAMPTMARPQQAPHRARARAVHMFPGAGRILEQGGNPGSYRATEGRGVSPGDQPTAGHGVSPEHVEEAEETGNAGSTEPAWMMSPMERACLEFCIELLNQRHRAHEYESPLVCAMAVLGWGETGWRDPDSYPPPFYRG
ncbi:uncharacterized protein ACHE_60008A [Aspergillus chevalieri]|uniref:Uncharacterized protein n=1 Tax=Aspergillus chevalieri TaxID=182096 RepID=A0A7R7ZR82_ASPCH|nr:uncharacterized protein ACHE_60008A [Aspergillus chevalieri]BCR90122.1 hypothetical protein ACHE_60008A [Aspergillus chevalieri]